MSLVKSAIVENYKNWDTFRGYTLGTIWDPLELEEVEKNIINFIRFKKLNKVYFCIIKKNIEQIILDVVVE